MEQIVAITVFFLLVVAFYAFFSPFLGDKVLEYVAIGIYTPVVSLPNNTCSAFVCNHFKAVHCTVHLQFVLVATVPGVCCLHPFHSVH
jgi:hypothetical protein